MLSADQQWHCANLYKDSYVSSLSQLAGLTVLLAYPLTAEYGTAVVRTVALPAAVVVHLLSCGNVACQPLGFGWVLFAYALSAFEAVIQQLFWSTK